MRLHGTAARIAALAFVAAGCNSGKKEGEAHKAAPSPSTAAQPTAPAPATAPPAAKRDVSAIDTCQLIKAEEVAGIAGGKLLAEPSAKGPACMYTVEVAGTTVSYLISFQDAGLIEPVLEVQSEAEKGEKIEGAWDEAYLQPRTAVGGLQLLAIWRGDVGLEVAGDRKEPILEIAKLAASRLP